MPAPKFLSRLPKPILFGLYGAVGGFAGALVLAEPLYQLIHLLDDGAKDLRRVALVFLGTGAWTAGVAAPLCLALLVGQHYYLRGSAPEATRVLTGLLGGATAGITGGTLGQFCFCFAPEHFLLNCIVRTFAWILFGGLAGAGLSLFVPNMPRLYGFIGGAVGGAVGCIGFLLVSFVVGDMLGRFLGGLVIGFCIGAMVVVAETAFRRAWLEVRYGDREVITVNLGPEPVKVGGDARTCAV